MHIFFKLTLCLLVSGNSFAMVPQPPENLSTNEFSLGLVANCTSSSDSSDDESNEDDSSSEGEPMVDQELKARWEENQKAQEKYKKQRRDIRRLDERILNLNKLIEEQKKIRREFKQLLGKADKN